MSSPPPTAVRLGYARASAPNQSLDRQIDALTADGVTPERVYIDAPSPPETDRTGLAALLDYARRDDTVVVVGIDRLGRSVTEVMSTVAELGRRGLRLRSLREQIDTAEPAGHMIVGVLASLSELDDEPAPRRAAPRGTRRPASGAVGRPRALDPDQVAQAERMRASGHRVPSIAETLGVSRATLYRTLATRETR
ncbi:recombinase family protein [Gordonia sp. CPCC 206044]|uniref:recombinase family protein n=1 Tax=Gordonia sp. CPCC 206044 TaxID=3140793 RepID=UPI003AF3848D